MQTLNIGACLLAFNQCSPARVRMLGQDSRSAHGLLYPAAVWDDSEPLVRRLCHACPLPAYSHADLPKCCSLLRSRWQR